VDMKTEQLIILRSMVVALAVAESVADRMITYSYETNMGPPLKAPILFNR
jgi:hypothetical protein